jgi:hypothetical protein
MIRTAAALILLLLTTEVRSETVDVKYRGTVDLKTFDATRRVVVSFSEFVTTNRSLTTITANFRPRNSTP